MFPNAFPFRVAPLAACAAAVLLAACSGDDPPPPRGAVVSDAAVATFTKAQIDGGGTASGLVALTGRAACDVTVRKLVYNSQGPDGLLGATVSGVVLVPVAGPTCPGPFPLVSYSRGTEFQKTRTLSNPSDGETSLLAAFFAAQGYAVVASDYLGLGESSFGYHPYLEADSTAIANIDAIRAARAVLGSIGVALSGKVFVTGYSQGGHAAMATHRRIEQDAAPDLVVTASGPMSGPYNLSGSFVAGLSALPQGTGGSTGFVPYALTGYQKAYGGLYATPTDYFKAPYAAGIESLLPVAALPTAAGTFVDLIQSGRLPVALGDLITPQLVADVQNPATPVRRALDRNTLLGWTPRAPVIACGGRNDPVVLFAPNTPVAVADFASRGATAISVDVENVPDFTSTIAAQLAQPNGIAQYHGTIVPPLCLKVVRDSMFATLR